MRSASLFSRDFFSGSCLKDSFHRILFQEFLSQDSLPGFRLPSEYSGSPTGPRAAMKCCTVLLFYMAESRKII